METEKSSLYVEARNRADEFLYLAEVDDDIENIPHLKETLPKIMRKFADISMMHDIVLPNIFECSKRKLGFLWPRDAGNCYLYVDMLNMSSEWAERRGVCERLSQKLVLTDESQDWKLLANKLVEAYGNV